MLPPFTPDKAIAKAWIGHNIQKSSDMEICIFTLYSFAHFCFQMLQKILKFFRTYYLNSTKSIFNFWRYAILLLNSIQLMADSEWTLKESIIKCEWTRIRRKLKSRNRVGNKFLYSPT